MPLEPIVVLRALSRRRLAPLAHAQLHVVEYGGLSGREAVNDLRAAGVSGTIVLSPNA